jgi:UDP-N-acetylglucosamine--N-acetylmuramyl-(pentapeptide) pyrophosphoryl-undecaprenol N-acetylglucosamine transferase
VIHATGRRDEAEVRAAYELAGVDAFVAPFIADIGAVWATADLALCRAGGTTVAELAATRLPGVLVPLTVHADRHQVKNAESWVIRGGAVLLREVALGPETIRRQVLDRIEDAGALARMRATYARNETGRTGRTGGDAAGQVASLLMRVAGSRRRRRTHGDAR